MKAFVVFAAAIAISQAASLEGVSSSLMHAALQAKWSTFKATHGKDYHPSDESVRMQAFLERTHLIESHNERHAKGLESFRMAHNQFSDLTEQEMQSRMGVRLPENVEDMRANATMHIVVPSSGPEQATIDYRWWGGVTPVKNQGQCGSCYSFSASGALETAEWMRNKKTRLPDVSEQNIVDCTVQAPYNNHGCSGGWMWNAFKYIQDVGGIMPQSYYPYEGTVGSCRHNKQHREMGVSTFVYIKKGDEEALRNAVQYSGAVSIAYNAGSAAHANYDGGILDAPNCGNTPTHAVTLIGYGTEDGKDYWLLKNSWGDWWGEKGYFRMARGKNMCGIADWASYPVAG